MTQAAALDAYGVLTEPATLKIQRFLPGPIERVWAYLTESDLRRQWLAAGEMELKVGAPFAFTWRNDELTDPPGKRPDGFGAEHTMQSRIVELEPQRKLAFEWSNGGKVSIELQPHGDEVLLTVIHDRLPERPSRVNIGAGWHSHLDQLAARLSGTRTGPFWDGFKRLQQDYDRRLPA